MADRKGSAPSRATNAAPPADPPTSSTASAPSVVAAMSNIRSTSPYGTRSRNRGARVNYAEDKDNEMDFEFTTPYNVPVSSSKPTGEQSSSSSGTSRRQSAAVAPAKDTKDGKDAALPVPPSSTTTTTAGKKRKGGPSAAAAAAAAAQLVIPMLSKDPSLSNMLSFDHPFLQDGKLVSDDGTAFAVHDHIYLVCEPPGEPYYLARIMEFLHANNDLTQPIDAIRVNWYYRPKDIQRKVTDTRVLFASMHSDTCPLSSIRGKCLIKHRSEIENIDEYRKCRDSFYFERMFDRYIQRYYDVIPSTAVRNVPEAIRKVLVERWKYLLVEPQRGKELCSQMKECKRCSGYCANTDSVHCAVCSSTYHMNCVRPPLLKKPSRGFAWACGPCNRAQERKLEARNTPALTNADVEEDVCDDEEDDLSPATGVDTPSEPAGVKHAEPTPEQLAFAQMWQMRYLGQHCHVEDALDYDDRIYPRAASRLGSRHQATVLAWPGRPVQYIKPPEKKKTKGGNKNKQQTDAEQAAREKRPKWVMEEPPGYVERGKDDGSTSTLLFKIPAEGHDDNTERQRETHIKILDDYMDSTRKIAEKIGMHPCATNFMDKAAELLYANDFNDKKSLEQLSKVQAVRDLKEPRLKPEEVKRFEEGVAKYGSELHSVTKHVKSRKESEIVRFYYQWKKTQRGRDIWGSYEGRKGKKEAKMKDKDASKLVDDVADDEDDSAFDVEKASDKKRGFECKFCNTRHSRQWRRAPGVAPGTLIPAEKSGSKRKYSEDKWLVSALCRRCAELWRRYGIRWEDPDEVQRKMGQGGGRAWKRRIDEELLKELTSAQEDAHLEAMALAVSAAGSTASVTPQPSMSGTATPDDRKEPPKKKAKTESNGQSAKKDKTKAKGKEKEKEKEKEREDDQSKEKEKAKVDVAKEKVPEKVKEPPPPPPEPPKPKVAACGVCGDVEEIGKQHAVCRDCKMTVHKRCYGVGEMRSANKWVCEMCSNDKNPAASTTYDCVLCPEYQDPDAEPEKNNPYHKTSYKKKAAQDKANKESPEVDGRKIKDADKHKPNHPREPLKRTSGDNWAHVICAVWTPEIKFSDPSTMKVVEGIGTIPTQRHQQECKVCKVSTGATVQCVACHANVHINCANKSGWRMGFDIQPVKGSRRDTISIVKLGNEAGLMTACLWCPEHEIKSTVHRINEISEETGLTAMELFLKTYKQADLSLTGTVRKASLVSIASKGSSNNRRNSLIGAPGKEGSDSVSPVVIKDETGEDKVVGFKGLLDGRVGGDAPKRCIKCYVEVSPMWWVALPQMANGARSPQDALTNGNTPKTHTAAGVMCSRCHTNDKEVPIIPFASKPNGTRIIDPKYTPLPPLHVFLAQQHQHAAMHRQQQVQQQQALPPHPPTTVPMRPGSVTPSAVPPPPPPMASPQRPPMQMGMIPHPPMPPHGMQVHQVPPPPPPMHHGHQPHHQPHHQPPPHPVPHQPSPHQHHMPPRPPPPTLSHSPHMHHGSPQPHVVVPPRPLHMPPQPPPHLPPHLMSPRHPPHPPPHVSPPPPPPMMVHQPMVMHRQNPVGHLQSQPQQQHQPPQQRPPPPPPQEEPRRIMSGASGSPALANLLS